MLFYLGTHQVNWLGRLPVPLMLSARRLRQRGRLPVALAPWALDSGGFSELRLFGAWRTTPEQYSAEVRDWQGRVGNLGWAAIQDWMCEPFLLTRTGLTVAEHQRRTVANFLRLRHLAPEVPWVPVLQGWRFGDYLRHAGEYAAAGVDLARQRLVGLGSVCRRQGTGVVESLARELHDRGLRLHGFGLKLGGLRRAARWMASADSLAWSFNARRRPPLSGCRHKTCANCPRFALRWRQKILLAVRAGLRRPVQGLLW
jgi:hypothetical protein